MPRAAVVGAMIALRAVGTRSAIAADKGELSKNSQAALAALYAKVPAAKALGAKAQAILASTLSSSARKG